MEKARAQFVIEVAHEVVDAVGGIYTVMATKAKEMNRVYGKRYLAVGPYHYKSAKYLFKKEKSREFKTLFKKLEKKGIRCHYGTWLVDGNPKAILIDYADRFSQLERIKTRYTKHYEVDALAHKEKLGQVDLTSPDLDSRDLNLQLVWGDAARILIQALLEHPSFKDKQGVVHYQELDPSMGLLVDLARNRPDVGQVVTFHSTILGRELCMQGEDLYGLIEKKENSTHGGSIYKLIEKKEDSTQGGQYHIGSYLAIFHQFSLLSAKYADVLTAVSDVVSRECGYMLGRKADIITPNGINTSRFPSLEERAVIHQKGKERLWRFLEAYFLPYYDIHVSKSRIMVISGRHEYVNKGYDVFIEALGNLNERLKKSRGPQIYAFILVYDPRRHPPNYEVLENLAAYKGVRELVYDEMADFEEELIYRLIHQKPLRMKQIVGEEFMQDSMRQVDAFKRTGTGKKPPLSVVEVPEKDDIIAGLATANLTNAEEDKVKVVYYPMPVSVGDGYLSMRYDHAIAGAQIGVFPSYYEPWGYTPQETAARGLISVTTDLAGFGDYVQNILRPEGKEKGIYVLPRRNRSHNEVVTELTKTLSHIVCLNREKRIAEKIAAKKLSDQTSWRHFITHYVTAHNLAIERAQKRVKT